MCEGSASVMWAREGGNVRHGGEEGSPGVISAGGSTGQRRLGMADGMSVGLRVVGVCVGGCNMCEGKASEMCAREGGNVRHGEGEGSRCVISVGGTTGQRRLGMADGMSVGLRVVGVCGGGAICVKVVLA